MSFICVYVYPLLGIDLIHTCLYNYAPLFLTIIMQSLRSDHYVSTRYSHRVDDIIAIIICVIITIAIPIENTITIDYLLIAMRGRITEMMVVVEGNTIEALRQVGFWRTFWCLATFD
jgi:hypothetical protein